MNYVMETQNLSKKYQNVTVVDHVNLHIPKGKIYGLLGRNGAGKTTIMKMMLQLVSPTAGKIMMFGKDHREQMKDTYQKIGSIIETPGFYTNLTGQENLEILARLRRNVSKESVLHALEIVGLDKEKKKPESRGKSRNRLAAGSPDPAVGSEVHAPDVFQPSDQAEKTDSLLEGKAAGAEKGQTILKDSPKRPDTFEQDVSGSPTEAPDGQIRTGYKPYGKWTILRPGMPGNNHIEVVIV